MSRQVKKLENQLATMEAAQWALQTELKHVAAMAQCEHTWQAVSLESATPERMGYSSSLGRWRLEPAQPAKLRLRCTSCRAVRAVPASAWTAQHRRWVQELCGLTSATKKAGVK